MRLVSKNRLSFKWVALCLLVAVAACTPRAQTRGNLPDPDLVAQLKEGDITRDEVAEFLGSPSSVTPFGEEVWFYISEQTETLAWFEPEIIRRQVLALHFNKAGTLVKIETKGLEEANDLTPVDRKTPTHGNKFTLLEQLVGNFRRFSRK
ncbi:MAG: outer membrane protein assembly factor BamE [Rhodospirillales bacterium]|nr:outer membrane protein assembly factor BamE [Rhodospirillales bacterium]